MTIRFRVRWWNLLAALVCVVLPAVTPGQMGASLAAGSGAAVTGNTRLAHPALLHHAGAGRRSPSVSALTAALTTPAKSTVRHDALMPLLMSSLVVTSSADSGPGTLRDAISQASAGDTITFAPNLGTITLTSGELLISTTLSINGPASATQTISGGGLSRIFEITATATVTLTNLTITDGVAPIAIGDNNPGGAGGGILNNGTLTITGCTVMSNTAGAGNGYNSPGGDGGGIANNGTLSISSSTVVSDSAGSGGPTYDDTSNGGNGGGIANTGVATVTASTIFSNTGGQGAFGTNDGGNGGHGGGLSNQGTLTVIASTITNNTGGNGAGYASDNGLAGAGGAGGGVANQRTMTVISSTVSNNAAGMDPLAISIQENGGGGGDGGGIENQGSLTVTASTIAANVAGLGSGNGGGIANEPQGTLTIGISTIVSNTAGNSGIFSIAGGAGGGIANDGTLSMSSSTLSMNEAGAGGGYGPPGLGNDIASLAGSTTFSATIIGGATSVTGSDCAGTLISADYNLIQNTSGCTLTGSTTHTITGTDPLLGPLQNNGGPTLTQAPEPGSPALDQVPLAFCAGTDQTGAPRPDDHESVCNIGAVESATTASGGVMPWHPQTQMRLSDHLRLSVDLADGHADLTAAGVQLPGRGPDLAYNTTWDSTLAQAGISTTAGLGWLSSLTPRVGGLLTQTVVYTDGSGAVWSFPYMGPLTATAPYTQYETPAGLPWQLSTAPAGADLTPAYTLTNILTGATRVFDRRGLLLNDGDAWGNQNTLAYSSTIGGAVPISLSNSGGRALSVLYNPANGLPWAVQSPLAQATGGAQGQQVVYGYTPSGQISGVEWGYGTDNVASTFSYSGTQLITATTQAGHAWRLYYDAQGRVSGVVSPGALTPAGYTPPYATAFGYSPGQTVVVQGYGSSAPVTTTYALSGQGEPITVTDALSNATVYSYDQDHDVLARRDANGHTVTNYFQYTGPPGPSGLGSTGLLTATIAPPITPYTTANTLQSPVTTYQYDSANNLIERDSPNGGRILFGYNADHAVITTTQLLRVDSNCALARHETARRPIPPAGSVQPDSCGSTYTWRASVNTYNTHGQVLSTIDPRGFAGIYTARPADQPSVSVDPVLGPAYTSSYTYTAQGDLKIASSPPITTTLGGTPLPTRPATTTYYPDADGNVAAVLSPNYGLTSIAYDHLGRTITITQPSAAVFTGTTVSPVETIGYDGDGNVARTTDGAGDPTTRVWDPLGRLVAVTNPVQGTTLYTYTATTLVAMRDPAGNVTRDGYDPAGRLITTTDPAAPPSILSRFGYDAVGNTTALTSPLDYANPLTVGVEDRQYDPLNDVVTDTVGGSGEVTPTVPQTTLTTYDLDGNAVQVSQPNGDVSYTTWDYADRPRQVQVYPAVINGAPPAALASNILSFDAADNATEQFDFTQYDHTASFDAANRATQRVDCLLACGLPGSVAITTTPMYDPDGNTVALTRTEPSGAVITATASYNADDWPTQQSAPEGTTLYGYDAAGRLRTQSLLNGAGVVTATLDAAGRATALSETITDTTPTTTTTSSASQFTYTPDGLPATATLDAGGAGQVQESRQYDGDNRLLTLAEAGPSGASTILTRTYTLAYSPRGLTQAMTTTDPTSPSSPFVDQYNDNALDQLRLHSVPSLGGANGNDTAQWQYDGNGNILSIASADAAIPSAVYTYTTQLPATSWAAGWLPNELVTQTITPLLSGVPRTATFGYDLSGNTSAITRTGVVTSLSYDAAGRFATASLPDGSRVGIGYNAAGLRATLAVTPTGATQPSLQEAFLYRAGRVGQVVVSGTPTSPFTLTTPFTETFLYRPDGAPLELLLRQSNQVTQRYWYALDGRGNVAALLDSGGSVVNTYQYTPWGTLIPPGVRETIPQPLRFKGYWDDSWYGGPLPWYWLTTRYYDPALGRFLQPDPSAQDGVRSYVYCHDQPVDCADPSGLSGNEGGAGEGAAGETGGGDLSGSGLTVGPGGEIVAAAPGEVLPATEASGVTGASPLEQQLPLLLDDVSSAGGAAGSADSGFDVGSSGLPTGFDRDAAIASAKAARRMLGRIPFGKTVAAVADGRRTLSGWASKPGYVQATDEVMSRAQDMGYSFEEHKYDRGVPGRYYASHAETQMSEVAPGQPFAVSRAMCPNCQDYFRALAQYIDVPQTVADPSTVRIFYPDGTVEEIAAAP